MVDVKVSHIKHARNTDKSFLLKPSRFAYEWAFNIQHTSTLYNRKFAYFLRRAVYDLSKYLHPHHAQVLCGNKNTTTINVLIKTIFILMIDFGLFISCIFGTKCVIWKAAGCVCRERFDGLLLYRYQKLMDAIFLAKRNRST